MKTKLPAAAMMALVVAGNAWAGEVTREQCVRAMTFSGLVKPDDFEAYRLEDGRTGVKVQQPDQGVMVACIGAPGAAEEALAILTADESTAKPVMFLLFAVTQAFSEWDGAADWVSGSLQAMGDTGGSTAIIKQGRRFTLTGLPNGVVMLNVKPKN